MEQKAVKDIKQGEFIKLSADATETWMRGDYYSTYNRYSIISADNISKSRLLQGSRKVFIGFTY